MEKFNVKSRKRKDGILNGITGLFSTFSFIILLALLIYIFQTGSKSFSFKMLTADYYETPYFASVTKTSTTVFDLEDTSDIYYSKVWGIGLSDSTDLEGNKVVRVAYIDNLSPLKNLGTGLSLEEEQIIVRISIINKDTNLTEIGISSYGAKKIASYFDMGTIITEIYYSTEGGGIRGSIITTLYLILLTLVIAIPIGVIAAIYLSEYARDNKLTRLIRSMIDMIGGIPSIIFGLIALSVFIPFVNSVTNKTGGSILSGALTLSLMLLPTIIRTTEEAINTIPKSYREASLALGASKTETTFKIILPNALGGILTSTLLSIGRIIGESAALIFAIGTSIKDSVSVLDSSTSLSVHIWTVLSSESPNYSQACAISIVIIFIVLILNISIKLITRKLNRFGGK